MLEIVHRDVDVCLVDIQRSGNIQLDSHGKVGGGDTVDAEDLKPEWIVVRIVVRAVIGVGSVIGGK